MVALGHSVQNCTYSSFPESAINKIRYGCSFQYGENKREHVGFSGKHTYNAKNSVSTRATIKENEALHLLAFGTTHVLFEQTPDAD